MKSILVSIVAAVLVVRCGLSAPGISIHEAAKDGVTPLYLAAVKGYKEIVELLIAEGVDVNTKDTTDETPLHYVTGFRFRKEIAKLLIAKGADVDGWSGEETKGMRRVNNLKQIGIAAHFYATDNQDRFPWLVSQAEGGTAEVAQPRSDTDALLDSDGKPIFDANAWLIVC